jgi:polyisoprenyl-phosphate glycosyltransferase
VQSGADGRGAKAATSLMRLSIITPAFNEAENLEVMYARLSAAVAAAGLDWEWVVVDDHSRDATFDVLRRLAIRDPRVRGLRLSRNSGSHTAIACGLHHVTGDAAVVLAGDLQDPPETLASMLAEWRAGAQVVWAVRRERAGESMPTLGFSRIYYFIMRHVVGMREMPATGADFFLADRIVIDAFRRFPERHVSVLALVTWMGFRQAFIGYDKQRRHAGQSGWTLAKKVKLVVDSITGFTDVPIRLCSYVGALLILAGVLTGLASLLFLPALGAGLMLVLAIVIGLAGVQLLALGVVGEYVWRALDEARRRPPYLIEAIAGTVPQPVPQPIPMHE